MTLKLHHCDLRIDADAHTTRPGWRVHCLTGCRTWYFTDDSTAVGHLRASNAAEHHEETGLWPQWPKLSEILRQST